MVTEPVTFRGSRRKLEDGRGLSFVQQSYSSLIVVVRQLLKHHEGSVECLDAAAQEIQLTKQNSLFQTSHLEADRENKRSLAALETSDGVCPTVKTNIAPMRDQRCLRSGKLCRTAP